MRWKSICPCYWRGSPHFAGGRWRWINYWDHPQLTGRATCQCQRGLTSPYSLSMTNKMPTTFLVMTDPKELFLFFNISSALLPELGSPAGLNWSFSVSFLLIFSFPNFYGFCRLPFLWLFFPLVSLSILTVVLWLSHCALQWGFPTDGCFLHPWQYKKQI